MVSKPDWIRKMEEEQSVKLISRNQADEINLSHRRILADAMPGIWEKFKLAVDDVMQSTELYGMRFSVTPVGTDSIRISIYQLPSPAPKQVVNLYILPEKFKLEMIDSSGQFISELFFAVSEGRVVISVGDKIIPQSESTGLSEMACQILLEPLLRPYL